MTTVAHSAASGVHPASLVASSDPGAPAGGAHVLWVDTSAGPPYTIWKRNAGNSGWDIVGYSTAQEVAGKDFSPAGLTGATAASRYVGATTSGAPGSGTFSVGDFIIDRTGHLKICTTGGSPGTWTDVGGTVSLTTATAQLSGDVTMTSANTFYDGPSISCAAGSWLIVASVAVISQTSTAGYQTGKLWDGTTTAASAEFAASTAYPHSLPFAWVVSPGGTTTYKVSVATTTSTSGKIMAAADHNAAGNTASSIVGLKVA